VFPKALHDVTVEATHESMDQAWAAAEQALAMPMAPAALELFSTGRLLARFLGSPDATSRMVADLGWSEANGSVWTEHAKRAPSLWARIAAPRHELRSVLNELKGDQQWWASPGTGIANWAISGGADEVRSIRALAAAGGGSLVLMAGPDDFRHDVGAWGTPPATLHLMRRLRYAFDPNQVINPGRFVV
jgi:FAD/FMN-containing dehydrogenase